MEASEITEIRDSETRQAYVKALAFVKEYKRQYSIEQKSSYDINYRIWL